MEDKTNKEDKEKQDKEKEKESKEKEDKKRDQTKLEEIEQRLKECQKQKDEYLAGWQRTRADFLNYKKEEIERVEEILKYANLDLILKILSVLDNFDLAEKELLKCLKDDENVDAVRNKISNGVKGVLQIKTQILDFLKNQGIEEIKAVGEKFDPNFHEAVEEVEAEDKESGMVAEETQKGYILHGKVIRPTKVKVVK